MLEVCWFCLYDMESSFFAPQRGILVLGNITGKHGSKGTITYCIRSSFDRADFDF